MTSRELVYAAIAHRQTARVPYCIGFARDGWDAFRAATGVADPDDYVDNDVLRVGPPWWTWHELADDWRGFEPPASAAKVIGTGSYPQFVETLKRCREESDKYILACIYGSHFEKAYFARGIENFLADMAGSPEFTRRFLAKIVDKNMVMLENILALPEIDGVLLGSDWGSQQDVLMSPEVWQETIRPGEQREYDLVHAYGKHVWVHSCGQIERLIPSLVDMGLDVLNPVQPECMDIAGLKTRFGDRLSFWGGLSTQQTLPFGSPDQVKAEARRVRDLMSEGGGHIFAPAQELQSDVPPANVLALLEVAREDRGA